MGREHESESVRADRYTRLDLRRPRHGARWRVDDRSDDLHRAADGAESGLRSRMVRDLHRPAGGDRRADTAAWVQPVRLADDEWTRQQLRGLRIDPVFLSDGA